MKQPRLPATAPESEADIESAMRTTSLIVSVIALALMVGGLVLLALFDRGVASEHYPVVPLSQFIDPLKPPLGLMAVSTGVVLLCLLPAVRVVLALWVYLRSRSIFDALVALLVLVELLFGMQT